MKYIPISFLFIISLLCGCNTEEATQYERTNAMFIDSLGGNISVEQWWRTAVTLKVNVTTDEPMKVWLTASQYGITYLCDYKELSNSTTITMTAPQGQGQLYLNYIYKKKILSQAVTLSGKTEEFINLNVSNRSRKAPQTRAGTSPPASLCGNSIQGNAKYYQFTDIQLDDFFTMMDLVKNNLDAKNVLGLNCNYELESNGPFYITWANGYEAEQRSRILGYYYHSPNTYDDIKYVDLSETHKWDYIDGLAKVQYQFDQDISVDGYLFKANTWYDANFDMHDTYGATKANNPDRVGDNAYNSQEVYYRYSKEISAMRGISFLIDVPEGMRIGFYLRSDEEPLPSQWNLLQSLGVKPYVSNSSDFMGTCFCAEKMNEIGNGRGKHRSFIADYEEVIWMGMEDLLDGGDHDCNDVIFGVVADLPIFMPDIVDPELVTDPMSPTIDEVDPFPWTIAYEDTYRDPDFDFNDAVIKLLPDYINERCCVMVMAAGSPQRLYLHYDGPDGDRVLGEMHELMLGGRFDSGTTYINTKGSLASTPFVTVDCVPWPKEYTMANDAKRFYIEIQRGSCTDCNDFITLAQEPGKMPEALLVAGEWKWPMERVHIFDTYEDFPSWARDVTRTRFWEWYSVPTGNTFVSY